MSWEAGQALPRPSRKTGASGLAWGEDRKGLENCFRFCPSAVTLTDRHGAGERHPLVSVLRRLSRQRGLLGAGSWEGPRPAVGVLALLLAAGPREKSFYVDFGLFILR